MSKKTPERDVRDDDGPLIEKAEREAPELLRSPDFFRRFLSDVRRAGVEARSEMRLLCTSPGHRGSVRGQSTLSSRGGVRRAKTISYSKCSNSFRSAALSIRTWSSRTLCSS